MLNVILNYTGLFTDTYGNYNFSFSAPSSGGNYPIKVNSTYANIPGENSQNLVVQEAPTSIAVNVSSAVEGFGRNITLITNISGVYEIVNGVNVEVTSPGETPRNFSMRNDQGGVWKYNFTDFTNGTYFFKVHVNSSGILTTSANTSF